MPNKVCDECGQELELIEVKERITACRNCNPEVFESHLEPIDS